MMEKQKETAFTGCLLFGCIRLSFLLQVLQQEIGHFPVKMHSCIFPGVNAMIRIGIQHQLEILVGSHQCGDQVVGILRVHVIVGHAMDEHEFTLEFFHVVDG